MLKLSAEHTYLRVHHGLNSQFCGRKFLCVWDLWYGDWDAHWIFTIVVTVNGVRTGSRIYWTLTERNYKKDYALTVLHTSQITIGHTKSSQAVTVFTGCCSVAASNIERSPSTGFPNCQRLQLPAVCSNRSQQLNPSSYLTDWQLTNLRTAQKTQFLCCCFRAVV
jgi:hypothetical protein